MRVRYQGGYLRLGQRKKGPDRWEFLWWDFEANGTRVRRKAIIGTVKQYPNLENAWQASNGLRVSINETHNRQREQTITVADHPRPGGAVFQRRIFCSRFFSKDTATDEERKKVIKKFQRWVRFPTNDRSVPASDQQ